MESSVKRKAAIDLPENSNKRTKTKKQWKVTRKNEQAPTASIQAGDSGIWATCIKGREGKCVGELRDLFGEYADLLYAEALSSSNSEDEGGIDNIESNIDAEIADLKTSRASGLFTSVRLDVQCVVFFKTRAPVEPVSFVQKICEDASEKKMRIQTRFAQRLTPMTLMGPASTESLAKIAAQVLAPHFHGEPLKPHKYAIRPNMRNHAVSPRDAVIKQIASIVGNGHKVDLQHYDLLILVEFYKNICGVSVVTGAYEKLKRFNLAELTQIDQDPSPQDRAKKEFGRGDPRGSEHEGSSFTEHKIHGNELSLLSGAPAP